MTTYPPHKVRLSNGQNKRLARAFATKKVISLQLKRGDTTGGSDTLHLTETQIKKLQRVAAEKKGAVVKMSETQLRNTTHFIKAQVGGKGLHIKRPPPPMGK